MLNTAVVINTAATAAELEFGLRNGKHWRSTTRINWNSRAWRNGDAHRNAVRGGGIDIQLTLTIWHRSSQLP